MNRIGLGILFLFLAVSFLTAQQNITNEAIWQQGYFYANRVPGFNFLKDGKQFSRKQGGTIVTYDLTTGQQTNVIFDAASANNAAVSYFSNYQFSEDEQKLILETNRESIYRRSSKADFYIFDRAKNTIQPLFEAGKQMYATFSPKGDKVAFVHENNLYYKNLTNEKVTQITNDGAFNKIINGALDWVYEEEFGFSKGFQWAPDGKSIAFYRFDESEVKEFTMTHYYGDLYPEYETFKYPKVGEKNSEVTIKIYNLQDGKIVNADIGEEVDQYIPRIKWTRNPNQLCIYRLNRLQNELELLLTDRSTGQSKVMLTEKDKYYIEDGFFDNLVFLKSKDQFIWSSEKSGWNHAYLYDLNGKKVKQLTEGEWDITKIYGYDEVNQTLYYQAAKKTPMQREIYSVQINNLKSKTIAGSDGTNNAQFSSTYDYYILNHSRINHPNVYTVFDRSGKEIRELEDNARLKSTQKTFGFVEPEFFDFSTSESVQLNGWMIKPDNFDPKLTYPVMMFVYGGPGSQTVTDSWGGSRYAWYQMLAQQGFIVVSVDNRGTGARGAEFKKMTYQELGKYETQDQIEAAKYLANQPYIDGKRIGIFGWSYGGYMSSLCILKGNDVFRSAIAVAPVTNWKWYDTIYTERFMRTPAQNASGYKDNSPVYFADRLKGEYLLVHGNGDDNVHFQHTAEMANALIKANKQFDTYFYPNRNHGIYGDNARLHLYTKMTNFLKRSLAPVVVKP